MELDSESAMDLLSPDCRNHVFLFLGLKDCLRFAETSSTNLEHIIAQVQRRRYEQFMTRPCEELTVQPSLVLPFSVRESSLPPDAELVPRNTTTKHPHLHPLQSKDGAHHNRRRFYALPTIRERIQSLYANIPRTHPFREDLKNLVQDLQQQEHYPYAHDDAGTPNQQTNRELLLKQLSSVTYAHRLHASLLSRCTTQLDPQDHHGSFPSKDVFNASLDRYMGDVLSARTLVGHTYCDVRQCTTTGVEGGPSMEQWIRSLGFENGDWNSDLAVKDWYKFWVFFHSTFLRVGPLSVDQAEHLALLPLSGILNPFPLTNDSVTNASNQNNNADITANERRKQAQSWFAPSRTYARVPYDFNVRQKWLPKLFQSRTAENRIRHGYLDTIFYDFGPLGPSFRGRDSVQTRTMNPKFIFPLAIFATRNLNNYELCAEFLLDYLQERNPRGRLIQWMKLLQDECQKNRPMTVRSPFVTIRLATVL